MGDPHAEVTERDLHCVYQIWIVLLFVVVVVVRDMFLFGSYLGAGICATGQYALSS